MEYPTSSTEVRPRIIIHGGAGHITRENLPPPQWHAYRTALLRILRSTKALLSKSSTTTALDAAVHAVQLLEDDPLFNAGRGAVFNREGRVELEASVMVSKGSRKRGTGVTLLKHVKSPISLAREVLLRGEEDDGGGAYGHCQISGEHAEKLAKSWGLELVEERYFWTRKRWEEHQRGLDREKRETPVDAADMEWPEGDPSWNPSTYLPQGTVGCVVLDASGTICVATSTGGITNKIPGRIGDTPTLGAGFWAEEWIQTDPTDSLLSVYKTATLRNLQSLNPLAGISACLFPKVENNTDEIYYRPVPDRPSTRSVGMSGTGNGDSFLRVNAVRTAAAISRFSILPNGQPIPLGPAISSVAGPNGELQRSAGSRWSISGEGEGGIIGIELKGTKGTVHFDFNCGGLFRAWIDDDGHEHCEVFRGPYELGQ